MSFRQINITGVGKVRADRPKRARSFTGETILWAGDVLIGSYPDPAAAYRVATVIRNFAENAAPHCISEVTIERIEEAAQALLKANQKTMGGIERLLSKFPQPVAH